MKKIEEDILLLENNIEMFESIKSLLKNKNVFKTVDDLQHSDQLSHQVDDHIEQIISSINLKKELAHKIRKNYTLAKRILFFITIPILLTIIIIQYLDYYELSVVASFLFILFLLLLLLLKSSLINIKLIIVFIISSSLLFLSYGVSPPIKNFINSNSSSFTFFSLLYALIITFYKR